MSTHRKCSRAHPDGNLGHVFCAYILDSPEEQWTKQIFSLTWKKLKIDSRQYEILNCCSQTDHGCKISEILAIFSANRAWFKVCMNMLGRLWLIGWYWRKQNVGRDFGWHETWKTSKMPKSPKQDRPTDIFLNKSLGKKLFYGTVLR